MADLIICFLMLRKYKKICYNEIDLKLKGENKICWRMILKIL